MKKLLLFIVSVVSLGFVGISFAGNIAVFDFQKVMQNDPQVTAANKKLQKEFGPELQTLNTKRNDLVGEFNSFQRTPAAFSMARSDLAQGFTKNQQDFRAMQQDFQQKFVAARNKELQKVIDNIKVAANAIAKRHGYDYVIAKDSVAYAPANVDVTNEMISYLKKK